MSDSDAVGLTAWVEVADPTDEYAGRTGRVIEQTEIEARVHIENREKKWYAIEQLRNVVKE